MTTPTDTTERAAAPLTFVDAETDGVHPGRKPWEIAVIRREPDGCETEWSAFVEIDLSDTPDGFGISVGKFYERHPHGQVLANPDAAGLPKSDWVTSRELAAHRIARMTHGAVLVGINPAFDADVLENLLRAHGLLPAWDYTPICAKTRAVGWLIGRGLLDPKTDGPPWRTADILEKLGIVVPDEERHTALGDAKLARRIYDALLERAS